MTIKSAWTYRWTDLPWLAGTAVVYALLAKGVLTFYSTNGLVTAFWPGAGISLAAILLGGRRFWVGIYVGAVAAAVWAGESPQVAALISVGSVLEALLGAWLLTRRRQFRVSLRAPRDYFRLCYLAGALSPGVCALIGVGTLLVFGHLAVNDAGGALVHWWMGDTLGIVLVAPLVMVWRRAPGKRRWSVVEALALFGISFLAGQIVFFDWFTELFGRISHGYWMYLIVSWAAVRLGLHGVLQVVLMTTVQALLGLAAGRGVFANDLATSQLTNFWAHTMIVTTVGVSLAIIFSERERILGELRSSETRYASLFENMLDGLAHGRMIFRDGAPADYEILAVNPAFEKVTGLSDVVGRRIGEIIPGYARDSQISLDNLGRVVQTGEAARWEHYSEALNRWYSFAAYRPTEGEFLAVIQNITERKQAEDELRKLSQAIEQSPVSMVITDLEARIHYVNPAFTAVSGYTAAEARNQNPRLLQSGKTPRETYDALRATLHAGKVWHGEFINRRKDGTEFVEDATISPLRQADGRITHYVGVQTDITALKQTLAKLHASEDRLLLAKSAAGFGLYDHDLVSGALEFDERAREFWGIGTEELVSTADFLDGVHPDDRENTRAAADRAYDPTGDGEYYAEYRVVSRAAGTVRYVVASGRVFFENGRAVRSIGILRDISAHKQLEKEIQGRRSEMESLVNQQIAAQTAAAIAHELNQPLVAVSAYSEAALRILRGGIKSPEKLTRALEGAMEQAQRAGRTLHELLDFLHKGEATPEALDLNGVVREALVIAEESGYGGFHAVVALEPNLRPVLANRLQLQKVLVNLLHNGVEAMRSAGVPAAAITIQVRTTAEQRMAQVTVQDSGPGLDAEIAHRVFDPFFTTKPEGIGLGLAISRALIEVNGGQLWAEIGAGPGATFHFVLPFAP